MNRMYEDSVLEGYLTKSPPRMKNKWQRRYFVLLRQQKQLMYFSKYNGERKGTIDLERVQEILFDLYLDKGPSNVISLEVKGATDDPSKSRGTPDRIYYLLADCREDMETWHKQLMEVADLQLCRKINVVADSTQGDEYYISARRRTAIMKEGADKRGLANSFNPDSTAASEYGTYSRKETELSQNSQGDSYGLYARNLSENLLDISISVGEESSSDEDEFTRPDKIRRAKSPTSKREISKNSTRIGNKQLSLTGVFSLPLLTPAPLCLEEICPPLPPHRQEQMFPEELNFDLPLAPERSSSRKRLKVPRYPAPAPGEDKPIARERKSMFSRVHVKSEESDSLQAPSLRRPAAKMPSIPVNVLLTTVKEIPSIPVPKPRRPSSSCDGSTSDTPTSPVAIVPYRTVQRGSDIFPDEEPIYANDQPDHGYINVDPKDGTYVKFDPVPSDESEGAYVSVSRAPMDIKKLSNSTDTSGYTKIVEPKPRSKMAVPVPVPGQEKNSCGNN